MFASQDQVRQLARDGRLIDVRTAAEFRAVHLPGAINLPLDAFNQHAPRLAALAGPVVLTCHSGKRAEQARVLLASCQKIDVMLVEGGTEGWRAAGGEVELGRSTISLERQVRILAGALVAVGSALALGVDPRFALLPLVVGSGLTLAGITDFCGMGLVLARMPWNRDRNLDATHVVSQLEAACSSSA